MGIISDTVAGAMKGTLGKVFDRVADLIPDKVAAAQARADFEKELLTIASSVDVEQAKVNAVEAASPNLFIAGWRPFFGWVCGSAVAMNFVFFPLIKWWAAIWYPALPPLPMLDLGPLVTLFAGMLGLSGMRMAEKFGDVESNR